MTDTNQLKTCYFCTSAIVYSGNAVKSFSEPIKEENGPTIFEVLQNYTRIKIEIDIDVDKHCSCSSCTPILELIVEFTDQCNNNRMNLKENQLTRQEPLIEVDIEPETKFKPAIIVPTQVVNRPSETDGTENVYQRSEFLVNSMVEIPKQSIEDIEQFEQRECHTDTYTSVEEELQREELRHPSKKTKDLHNAQFFNKQVKTQSRLRLSCPFCLLKFKTKKSLRSHIQEAHSIEFSKSSLIHQSYHSKGSKTPKNFVTVSRLHSQLAKGKLGNVCLYCNKTFNKPSNVTSHINRVHLKQRPFSCQFCDKSFFSKSDFDRHLKCHSIIKCVYCNEYFETKEDVNIHMKTIHTHLSNCPHCDAFYPENVIQIHMDRCKLENASIKIEPN